MSTIAIVLTVLTAAGLVLLLWAIGRVVTAAGNRIAPAQGRSRHYLAGRLGGVRIATIVDYDGELLVSLATQDAGTTRAPRYALTSATTEPSYSPIPHWAATPPASRPPRTSITPATRPPPHNHSATEEK